MSLLEIRSEALQITGYGTEGLVIEDSGFEGWDDGAPMRTDATPRPQAHGDFPIRGWLGGRLVTLRGLCLAASPWELEKYRDQVMGHGASGLLFDVAVQRNGRTLTGTARLASGVKSEFVDIGQSTARWTMSWWFPDPRKYGEAFSFGPASSVTVVNRGNFAAEPRFRVTGSAPGGYTITGPSGNEIVVSRALTSGAPHEFDMADMRLYVDGTRVLGGVAKADRFGLRTGSQTVTVSGGLNLTVTGRETYI